MYQDEIILCSASKYTQKYYLNEDFDNLPTEVKNNHPLPIRHRLPAEVH